MMNSRIEELIVESGNGQFHNGKFYPHIGSRTTQDWKKFAELLIQECAYLARQCYLVRAVDAEDVATLLNNN